MQLHSTIPARDSIAHTGTRRRSPSTSSGTRPANAHDIEHGYEQAGVVHGRIDIAGESPLELTEVPANRWHRWGRALGPLEPRAARAHTGLRAAFSFPDGTSADWVLTGEGWASRGEGHDRRTIGAG